MNLTYTHRYAIKFKINRKLSNKEIEFLKLPIFELYSETSGIIKDSINVICDNVKINDSNETQFIGEKIIPLETYQNNIQKRELIFIWNELTQIFGEHIRYYPIEQGFIIKTFSSSKTKNVISPEI